MHGYILISNGSHEIQRIEADRVTRASLRKALEITLPEGLTIVGIVLGANEQMLLEAV